MSRQLVESIIGHREWEVDADNAGGIVSQYHSLADAKRDADKLIERGVAASTSQGNIGMPDEGKGYLWVLVEAS